MDWLSRISDVFRLPTRYVALIAVVSGAVLLLPQWLLEKLYLTSIPEQYKFWIGLTFLVATGLVVVNGASAVFRRITLKQRRLVREEALRNTLERLDPAEQALLREFLFGGTQTLSLPLDNPVVARLQSHGVIIRVGQYGLGLSFPFSISKDAMSFLTMDMLGVPDRMFDGNGNLTTEGRHWIDTHRAAIPR